MNWAVAANAQLGNRVSFAASMGKGAPRARAL